MSGSVMVATANTSERLRRIPKRAIRLRLRLKKLQLRLRHLKLQEVGQHHHQLQKVSQHPPQHQRPFLLQQQHQRLNKKNQSLPLPLVQKQRLDQWLHQNWCPNDFLRSLVRGESLSLKLQKRLLRKRLNEKKENELPRRLLTSMRQNWLTKKNEKRKD